MSRQKLLLFDLDGVILDGINEYWNTSLLACEKFLNSPKISIDQDLYKNVSNTFKEIRPWVKYGWEMVLITHEIIKTEKPLNDNNKKIFIDQYSENCKSIVEDNSWLVEDLQKFLDKSRQYQIDKDFKIWINLHKPFYEVIDFMHNLKKEKIRAAIITTKGASFAKKLLDQFNIYPQFIFGYESGTKIEIVRELSKNYEIIGFIEDRRKTLAEIKRNNYTKNIPCYLANWGYLKSSDRINLPKGISLLKLTNLEDILAF